MDALAFVDAGPKLREIINALGIVNRDWATLAVRKNINGRAMLFPIRAQL
jgi:hypothetical protein